MARKKAKRKAGAKKRPAAKRAKARRRAAEAVPEPIPAPAPKAEEVRVTAAKGRPMLTWVGKRPLTRVKAYPAQLVERHDALSITGMSRSELDNYDERMAFLRTLREHVNDECWKGAPEIGVRAPENGGLLFHGDNKEVLAYLLANGFRGKVDLVYIDPPFDSGADYVRKVSLRGPKGTAKLGGEGYTLGEQVQYTDIWSNDEYLQFLYERLLLLRELLTDRGSIYVHMNDFRLAPARCIMDEVFGSESFRNIIVWYFTNKIPDSRKKLFTNSTEFVLFYQKGDDPVFNTLETLRDKPIRVSKMEKVNGKKVYTKDASGKGIYVERTTRIMDNVWNIALLHAQAEREDYPTQKPEKLVRRMIAASSNPGDLVLDCFIGSGTTAAVAQRLGRRWIGCDINKGAIQTTAKRLQAVIAEQIVAARKAAKADSQTVLVDNAKEGKEVPPKPTGFGFTVWRVNDYDLRIPHVEAVEMVSEHLGVTRTRSDPYFDGVRGKNPVKIVPFGHPLTPLDLEELKRELEARPDEDRNVTVVCLGIELAARAWAKEWNRLRKGRGAVNRIGVIELRSDPNYGGLIEHRPAQAKVRVRRKAGKIVVEIQDFISPSIVERLKQQSGLITPKIDDWRAMVDCVMIDTAYDGKVFNVAFSDVPAKKTAYVQGRYELPAPEGETMVAVKIIDMLGEEILVTRDV